MKSKPLVSILINNYNKDLYCVDALNSAINQSYKNIEIIFYDDASTDNSIKKIIELKKKYKNKTIKIIENKDRGNIFSRNQMLGIEKSLKKSKGKIICLLDSDDFFNKDKIKKVVNFFEKNQSKDIVYDIPIFYYEKKKIYLKMNISPEKINGLNFLPPVVSVLEKKNY
jgi:glycosyltransferase involved in cell wall biosynthesis